MSVQGQLAAVKDQVTVVGSGAPVVVRMAVVSAAV